MLSIQIFLSNKCISIFCRHWNDVLNESTALYICMFFKCTNIGTSRHRQEGEKFLSYISQNAFVFPSLDAKEKKKTRIEIKNFTHRLPNDYRVEVFEKREVSKEISRSISVGRQETTCYPLKSFIYENSFYHFHLINLSFFRSVFV